MSVNMLTGALFRGNGAPQRASQGQPLGLPQPMQNKAPVFTARALPTPSMPASRGPMGPNTTAMSLGLLGAGQPYQFRYY